ncbi:MAG TPA: STAS domain-containing protein [Terriglobales bacterium]
MLRATALRIADHIIVRCQGAILVGEDFSALRGAVTNDASTKMVVLDMAGVKSIDAGGLGVLLGLREWAGKHSTEFKLMNVRPNVERVIKIVRLDRVFDFWTVPDMFDLIHVSRAANVVGGCSAWFGSQALCDTTAA